MRAAVRVMCAYRQKDSNLWDRPVATSNIYGLIEVCLGFIVLAIAVSRTGREAGPTRRFVLSDSNVVFNLS
jgi:hypothetical protein